jgi:histidyl-tRNA synthetase
MPKKKAIAKPHHHHQPDQQAKRDGVKKEISKAFGRLLGMKDIMLTDTRYLQAIINKVNEAAELYGFHRAETPIMENYSLYKKVMKASDLTELYVIPAGKSDKIALRPSLIYSLVRAYVEHGLEEQPKPVKLFSIGPVFRQEKVQSGHYRQFSQFAFSIFGEDKPISEAMMILVIYNIFKGLQIDVQIQINSLGNADCQKEYLSKFSKFFKEKSHRGGLCVECKKNFLKDPLSLFDCQNPSCRESLKEAPQITDHLSDASNQHFTRVIEYLDELGVNYNFNPTLIKGWGHYQETVFEVWPLNADGSVEGRFSLGRGGRNLNLVEPLGGHPTSLVSFSGGLERTLFKLKDANPLFKHEDDIIFLAQLGDQAKMRGLILFEELHRAGFNVRQAFTLDDLKGQLEEAKNLKTRIVLILGKKEVMNETILFRDVDQGVQEVIMQKDIKEVLDKNLKNSII